MEEESSTRYQKIDFLGEGQFATVFKAKDADTDRIVAVKKIKIGSRAEARDGINRTALREIKLMQEIHHENCLELLDVFGHKSDISLVFDFMITDLEAIIKDQKNIILYPAHVKSYTLQTLKGLEYLHRNWILHRDLKPNNLLIDENGILKIGDFGLAKFYGSPTRLYTHQVVTRWYRAPELLFGAKIYGGGVDIWAVGCILAELLLRIPLLAGESDLDQLSKTFQAMGTPTEETWPGVTQLPEYMPFKEFPGTPLDHIFIAAADDVLELLSKLLAMDPLKRSTCTEALQMTYFSNSPAPSHPSDLPLPLKFQKRKEELKRKAAGDEVAASRKFQG